MIRAAHAAGLAILGVLAGGVDRVYAAGHADLIARALDADGLLISVEDAAPGAGSNCLREVRGSGACRGEGPYAPRDPTVISPIAIPTPPVAAVAGPLPRWETSEQDLNPYIGAGHVVVSVDGGPLGFSVC